MRRSTRAVLAGVLALSAIGVWVWRLSAPAPPAPPTTADLDQLDPEVAGRIQLASAQVSAARTDAARWVNLGKLYEANELYPAARECYQQALALRDVEPRWWYRLAITCVTLGDLDAAIAAMQRATALTDYAPVHWRLGLWLLERGDDEAAEQALRRATQNDPNDATAWLALARFHLQRAEYRPALVLLERLAGHPGRNTAYAHQLLGVAYRGQGRTEDADAAFRRGQGSEADWGDPWQDEFHQHGEGFGLRMRQAAALAGRGQFRGSIALLEQMQEQKPKDANLVNNLAIVYRESGRLDESIRVLKEVLATTPDFYPSHFNLAVAYLRRADQVDGDAAAALRERAAGHLDRALEVNPSYAPAHAVRGDLLLEYERYHEALASFREASRCDPKSLDWPYRVARVQARLGQWPGVVETLEPLTRRAPTFVAALYGLGEAYLMLEQFDEAQPVLAEAARLRPDDQRIALLLEQARARMRPAPGPLERRAPRR